MDEQQLWGAILCILRSLKANQLFQTTPFGFNLMGSQVFNWAAQ